MSAIELALKKVKNLTESEAKELLTWLSHFEQDERKPGAIASPRNGRGFARRYRAQGRSTDDWMKELREGELP